MGKIFISYRREDSDATVGRIWDHLRARFGEENVFRDTNSISSGAQWRTSLDEALAQCGVMLVIIGPNWLNSHDQAHRRRLDLPDDYVRREIEAALRRETMVIPILVQGAALPPADYLPESIRRLLDHQAQPVRSDPDFSWDMERLIAALPPSIVPTVPEVVTSWDEHTPNESAEELVRRAQLLLVRGERATATPILERATRLDPSSFDAWCWLFQACVGPRNQDALVALEHASVIKPDDWSVWKWRAMLLERLGRDNDALEACKRTLELQPDDTETWRWMADVLVRRGDYQKAFDAFSRAIELNPYDTLASQGRETIRERLAHTTHAEDNKPEAHHSTSSAKGVTTPERVRSDADDECDFDVGDYILSGDVSKYGGNFNAAASAYEAATQRGRVSAHVWGDLGYCYNELRRWEDAMRAHDQALALNDDLSTRW